MKKYIVLLLFTAFAFSLNAQVYIGIRNGWHQSSIDFSPGIPVEGRYFTSAGLVVKFANLPYRGMQVELNYTQIGWLVEYEDSDFKYSRTFNCLELPVLSHFYIMNKATKIIINVGPNLRYHIDNSGNKFGEEQLYRHRHHFYKPSNKFEFGLAGGLGVFHSFEKTSIQLELRYANGLTKFIDSDLIIDSRTKVLSVSIIYFLNL